MVLCVIDFGFENCLNISKCLNVVSIFQYFPDETPALIGSSETNIESEIVYNARGGEEREPTIEVVEIEENVNARENDGGRGWGGTRGGGRRRQRLGRQKEKEEVELDNNEEEEVGLDNNEEEQDRRGGKDFRSYQKNLFRSSASQNYAVALSPILIFIHSQFKSCFY